MKIIVIIILLFGYQSANAQFLYDTISKNIILKNKVKEITIITTIDTLGIFSNDKCNVVIRKDEFDEFGNRIASITFDSLGEKYSEVYNTYNCYGHNTSEILICKQRKIHERKTFYQYENNRLIKEWSSDSLYTIEYYYNKLGQIEKTRHSNKAQVVTIENFIYDDQGNEIESNSDDNCHRWINKNIYDSNNKLIEKNSISDDDPKNNIFSRYKYYYNENGLLVMKEYYENNVIKENIQYEYDQMNNLVAIMTNDSKILYSYDSKGNRIKKTYSVLGLISVKEEYQYIFRE